MLLKNRDAKLADVGLSQILRNSLVKSLKGVGTFYWAALEVLAGTHPVCPFTPARMHTRLPAHADPLCCPL